MKSKIRLSVRHAIRLLGCVAMIAIMFLPCITFAVETRNPKDHEDLMSVIQHYGIESVTSLNDKEGMATVSNHILMNPVFGQEDWELMTVWETAGALWECGADLDDFKDELIQADSEYSSLAVPAGFSSFCAYAMAIVLYLSVITTIIIALYHVVALIMVLMGRAEETTFKQPFTAGLWWAYSGLVLAQPLISATVSAYCQYSVLNILGNVECRFRIFFEGGLHYLILIVVSLILAKIVDVVSERVCKDLSD